MVRVTRDMRLACRWIITFLACRLLHVRFYSYLKLWNLFNTIEIRPNLLCIRFKYSICRVVNGGNRIRNRPARTPAKQIQFGRTHDMNCQTTVNVVRTNERAILRTVRLVLFMYCVRQTHQSNGNPTSTPLLYAFLFLVFLYVAVKAISNVRF